MLARESMAGMYLGSTCSVNMSGRIITNDRPCGSQVTISERAGSHRISMSFCGKISFFFDTLESVGLFWQSSWINVGLVEGSCLLSIGSVSSVSAVAASMR